MSEYGLEMDMSRSVPRGFEERQTPFILDTPSFMNENPAPFVVDARRFEPAARRRVSAPGMRAFLAIADLWRLTEEERRLVLGYPSRSTYHNWAKLAREGGSFTLDVDTLARISAVLGIHQALGVLFASEADGVAWLRGPHDGTVFGGRPPLALLASGSQDALLTVRRFLDAARGGIHMEPNAADADFVPYRDEDIVIR
jgi:hypothetical protein